MKKTLYRIKALFIRGHQHQQGNCKRQGISKGIIPPTRRLIMIIFPGDYVKAKADGAWHLVRNTDANMLLLLDNGFLAYADESHIDKCLSADEYDAFVNFTNMRIEADEYNKRADARRQAWVDQEFAA
jgi:hypothetical protein